MSIIPVIYIVFQTAFVLKYVSLDSINEWWSVVIKYDVSLLDIVFLNNEKEAEIEYFFDRYWYLKLFCDRQADS